MGNLLDHFQSTEDARNKAHVDHAEQDKEKAVEEAASLERDIDTLANTFGKACTVTLLGPILHVNHVEDEAKKELKIEIAYSSRDAFSYEIKDGDNAVQTLTGSKFYEYMVGWLKGARSSN